ncbi:MAG: TIGR04283 family arsenosugar biosynthesis glycosyltransferase [Candidatus Methanoperedens sp.]|nr:TIGR04283 family arsenosugar biosynthesis glycosyltransferase [Candidatus Methanoperedens sp.]MCE8427523.1 TIGR04283 family arsenosugar biosynthesis glycosyltransferase [Candidatus Methanoperedens sp.]
MFNEENNIKPFLSHLVSLEGDFELIIVDGGSSDHTVEEVQKYIISFNHKILLLVSERGRAIQMNTGAKMAEGDILLFLHVDCALWKDALTIIEKFKYDNNIAGGGFKQAFSNPDLFLKFQSSIGNIRAGLTRVFFGDYGIFLKKKVFQKIGGYDDIPFLEDIEICRKAKRYGRFLQVDRRIVTSPRRYLKKGKVRLAIAFILANLFNDIGWRPGFLWKYIVEM